MSWLTFRPTLIVVALATVAGFFIAGNLFWLDTSVLMAIYALMALSVGVSFGLCGILSVAQAAFAALGAYCTAILSTHYGAPPMVGLLVAVALPAAFAYPFARLVTNMSHLGLAMATLLFSSMFDIVLREGGDFTGGYIGLSGLPPLPGPMDAGWLHGLVWGIVALVTLMLTLLYASPYGAGLKSVRNDALRAAADGIDVAHARSVALSLSAGIAGLAGWLYAHYISYLGPDSLGSSMSISVLLMAMVGGVTTVLGPILGAVALTLLSTLLPGAESAGMFYGGALLLVLLIAPKGLMSLRDLLPARSAAKGGQR
ncbi:branched-chain amino acid ABC transporter permease [Hoeflea alexandrii]|uniref:branched-chain amino acid ABC transporter permease n=1 Tax=Hoeflea alexandrii TaxID=288436 RepID=UPI0022AF80E7|nr:branched-chain amino acid ABC transporter permease [Hoeflea alexandrii]MCZ4291669.1 branched-chain amino acid ABC transporter permease [Hoeflea alexandrii]